MNKIAVLDSVTIDKIAAGEVVERPSSVVKELVENAMDAQASAVTVEIKDGGSSLIRITDNGRGIAPEEVPSAFFRHATSKIRGLEDLQSLHSLGFRGEALSSISAVSRVEMITRRTDALSGCRYRIEGGREVGMEEVGAPKGTTILVRNLFYNTPARAKFLKSPTTEASYIGSLMEQLALSHPELSVKYMQNGQTKLTTSGNGNLKEVIYQIYGRDITRRLIEVDWEGNGLKIYGYIGSPEVSRGNRNYENYYINGRYSRNGLVTRAIEDAYKSFVMQHKFPFTCLFIELSPAEVDVNVHPAKMEVRFEKGDQVYQAIYRTLYDFLRGKELIPEVSFGKETPVAAIRPDQEKNDRLPAPEPFEVNRKKKLAKEDAFKESQAYTGSILRERPAFYRDTGKSIPAIEKPAFKREDSKAEEASPPAINSGVLEQLNMFQEGHLKDRKQYKILGQAFGTYWIVEDEDRLLLIDQHAAHEKVMYEKLLHNLKERSFTSQLLALPLVLTLDLRQVELVKDHLSFFRQFGFEMEPFGGREYSVRAVPYNLFGLDQEQVLIELIDSLGQENRRITPEVFAGKLASMACKAAVKGKQKVSFAEAENLIKDLLALENPYHCPHGRPTIISMTKYDLEKKFKRIV